MLTSYHVHTRWSDGKGTVAETLDAAREIGLDEIGISDHFVLHPRGRIPKWSMAPERLPDYAADVLRHQDADGPRVRLGLEADWFPDHVDAITAALEPHPFDYVIGSVHALGDLEIDSTSAWEAIGPDGWDEIWLGYWREIPAMARSGLFDVVGHLDLPKKFGHRPTIALDREIDAALDAISEAGMVVELNTSGWHKPAAEAYPSVALLGACRARGIPAVLTADAHRPEHLLRDHERGSERLRAAGYETTVRFEGRNRIESPLS